MRRSLMKVQMIRVISSPSSSTTGLATVIFAMGRLSGLEGLDVGLLRANCLGGLLERGQLGVGEIGLHDLLHALLADAGLDAEIDAGDAVFPVHPGAHRQ